MTQDQRHEEPISEVLARADRAQASHDKELAAMQNFHRLFGLLPISLLKRLDNLAVKNPDHWDAWKAVIACWHEIDSAQIK